MQLAGNSPNGSTNTYQRVALSVVQMQEIGYVILDSHRRAAELAAGSAVLCSARQTCQGVTVMPWHRERQHPAIDGSGISAPP